MSSASRFRRRLIAVGFLSVGIIIATFVERAPDPWQARLIAPAAILYGALGLMIPSCVHDIVRPELGHLQLWAESGSRPFQAGLAAVGIGLLIGLVWNVYA
ncbi:hypothetical protein Mal4_44560 [Maioricimonas rarisocia]|uniref:Uncharacterized protein n=1 Tax=Maioricimonas rarisocia TaxID=2528026 RepID=A0A517ZCB9_9PLAN|nr:hypothetical protein [Maioricimonas rarisocia]QDU40102.1 hypothetical protein Mal4_44560 [Maioricimonas rarisocia]